jgi:hypothetical protein
MNNEECLFNGLAYGLKASIHFHTEEVRSVYIQTVFEVKAFSQKNFYLFQAKVFCAQKTLAWKLLLKGAKNNLWEKSPIYAKC